MSMTIMISEMILVMVVVISRKMEMVLLLVVLMTLMLMVQMTTHLFSASPPSLFLFQLRSSCCWALSPYLSPIALGSLPSPNTITQIYQLGIIFLSCWSWRFSGSYPAFRSYLQFTDPRKERNVISGKEEKMPTWVTQNNWPTRQAGNTSYTMFLQSKNKYSKKHSNMVALEALVALTCILYPLELVWWQTIVDVWRRFPACDNQFEYWWFCSFAALRIWFDIKVLLGEGAAGRNWAKKRL